MTTKQPFKVGLVGCGAVAQARHIPALLKIKSAKIIAICDKDEVLAQKVTKRFNIGKYYVDFAEMLESEQLDIVDITVSPRAHAALAIQAMKAGCHVLIEKPIAESVKEADEVLSVAKEKDVKLCVVHNNLFAPPVLKAKSMIQRGLLGEVTGIDIKTPWPRNFESIADKDHWYHKLPGGLFGEILPHAIYLAIDFLGKVEPVAVRAKKLTGYDWVAADELRIILNSEKGLGTITVSCGWAKNKVLIDIFGTKRSLHLDVINSIVTQYAYGEETYPSHVIENLRQGWQQFIGTAAAAINVITGKYATGHEALIRRFIQSMQQGTPLPASGEEGREVIRVFEKIIGQMESV